MGPNVVPVTDAAYFTATSQCIIESVATCSVAARNKCETWLRRQQTDPIPPKYIASIESGLPLFGFPSTLVHFAFVHLEQRMLVTVNVSVFHNLLNFAFHFMFFEVRWPLVQPTEYMDYHMPPRGPPRSTQNWIIHAGGTDGSIPWHWRKPYLPS